jgi:hypothetical protein
MDREMSGAEVQAWMGHGSEQQGSAYDHRTPDAMGEDARKAIGEGFGIGPIAAIAGTFREPRDRDTFLKAVLATAHITEYGMCARDWLSNPCVRHGACAACEKQLIRLNRVSQCGFGRLATEHLLKRRMGHVASAARSCACLNRSRAISVRNGSVASARISPTIWRSASVAPSPAMLEIEKVGLGGKLSWMASASAKTNSL